jgi:ribosomal protein S18 acetylase RimI-like enzyme
MAVVVDDQYRGSGIGTTLLDYSEETARTAGCARIVPDVAENNVGARQLSEPRGMRVEATSPSILRIPNTGAYRMIKPL